MMRRKKDFGKFALYLDPWLPGISRPLLKHGRREEAFMRILESQVEPGMAVLDLGANVGYTTMTLASIVGDSGCVYAIEPDPRNLKLLRSNVALNNAEDIVSVSQCAASDQNATAQFQLARKSNMSSVWRAGRGRTGKLVEVPLITLDTFFDGKRLPAFMKMDIEGHEVEALRGFQETISRDRFPLRILMEVHPSEYNESRDFASVVEKYYEEGFHSRFIISAGEPRPKAIADLGYEPDEIPETGARHRRALYKGISDEHAVFLASRLHDGVKAVRAMMLERP